MKFHLILNPDAEEFFHRGLIFAGLGPIVAGIVYAVLQGTSPDFSLPEGRSASPLFPHIFWHFCRQERRSSTKLKPGHCPNLCFAASPRCTPPTWGASDQYVDSLPSSGRAYFYRHFRCNLYYNLAHRLSDRPDNGKENDCSVALIFSTETEHKNDSLRIYCSVRSDFLCLSMKTNTRSEKSTVLPNKKTSSYECISENVPTKSVRN